MRGMNQITGKELLDIIKTEGDRGWIKVDNENIELITL